MEQTTLCQICYTDEAAEDHHIVPKSKGGKNGQTIPCCSDCGGQVHQLFTNKQLAEMDLIGLLTHEKMVKYIDWKKKHPGEHKHKASNEVKMWKKGHR